MVSSRQVIAIIKGLTFWPTPHLYDDDDNDDDHGDDAAAAKPTCHVTPAELHVRQADRIEVGCSVKFGGSIAPSIDCRWSAGNRWETINSSTTNGTALAELSILATPSIAGQSVQCTTYFSDDVDRSTAQSAGRPPYRYTWTSPTVHLVTGNYVTLLHL